MLDIFSIVICIEVNAEHNPEAETRIDRSVAMNNIGQPLNVVTTIAENSGLTNRKALFCY
jgi:hypothetical protein